MQTHWNPRDDHCTWGVYTVHRRLSHDNARFRARRARQSLWCTRKMWHSARWFGCPDRSAQLMRPVRDAWVPSGALRRRSSCDMTRGWLVAAPAAVNAVHRPGFPSNLHQRASKLRSRGKFRKVCTNCDSSGRGLVVEHPVSFCIFMARACRSN